MTTLQEASGSSNSTRRISCQAWQTISFAPIIWERWKDCSVANFSCFAKHDKWYQSLPPSEKDDSRENHDQSLWNSPLIRIMHNFVTVGTQIIPLLLKTKLTTYSNHCIMQDSYAVTGKLHIAGPIMNVGLSYSSLAEIAKKTTKFCKGETIFCSCQFWFVFWCLYECIEFNIFKSNYRVLADTPKSCIW